ncbi:TonB-dependent receptor domain-containing protein [Pedobacter zeae]|uniref:Outer membrane receptor protein involved in Fe transport n=1 Tax=Pedobacter zeae TaxID=1737356 RepID=A0A7W6KG53_9SPHI|nr:TonB-dependent receptor [Pedobacter zeae]MBB4110221.1 outer membrane receptor protein involved in Fe transport [Pedobacter zeae]GGH16740.1 TonB-dependent receptor [Pedobacter zeae]
MKTLFTLLACLLACGASFAQKLNKISGKIVDDKAVPVSFALVRVLNYPDTTVVRNASTNIDGEFSIDQLKSGDYVLSVSMVGFKSKKTAKFSLNGDLNMPVISIESLTRQLKEVSVQARKPFVEHQIDKMVLNVENSIVSSGSTALEILEKAPGVQIDRQNEQILLNNKSGVMVMIDGKNNFLSASDLTVYLNSLNSSQIATIEIITNPSAKYDAAGNSGIINIKLKKNKAFGTNGSISSTYRNAIRANLPTNVYGSELNFNLNHRVKEWNFYTNANASKNNNFSNLFLDRSTNSNGLQSLFNQNFQKIYTGSRLAAKLGADYFVSDKTTIGVMLDGSTSTRKLDNFSQTFITEAKADAVNKNSLIQYSDANTPNKNYSLNFNLKHDFKKEGASLNFDADYSGFDYSGLENFNANFYDAKGALYNNTIIRNNSKIAIDIYAAKTDFTWPISKSTKIETGLKSAYVKTNNDFLSSSLINNEWQNIVGQSNNFIYKENVNAAYANLSKDWGKWQLQAGLRAEYTQSTGTSVTNNTETKQHYLSLFPTVFVNQKISESSNLRYSYGRRIDRPNYQQLNPFNFYMDPYTIAQGNPYLKPQFTNNFEVSYNYKSGLSFSLGYSKTKDLILDSKTAQNDSTRIVTVGQGNIGSGQYYTAGLYFPLTIAKWWSLQSNFNLFYNKFKDDNLEGAPFTLSKVMYNFNINSSITLLDNWTFETNFWLNSPRVRGIERTTIYQKALNMGVQKSFLNKALRLRLNVDDIFQSNYWKGTLDYQNVNLRVQNNYISRRASFSISYNFGNQNLKSNQNRKTAADDIKNRAGG